MIEVTCSYCCLPAVLVPASEVRRDARSDALFWLCRPCKAWAGVHRSSPTHKPLGRLANRELRRLQHDARVAFEAMWRGGDADARMSRSQAHRWLGYQLEVDGERAHVGALDEGECRRLIRLIAERKTRAADPGLALITTREASPCTRHSAPTS